MLVRLLLVCLVSMLVVEQVFAFTFGGKINLTVSGQDCRGLTSGRHPAELIKIKEGDGYFAPVVVKFIVQPVGGSSETISAFKMNGADVLPASGNTDVIGKVMVVNSSLLAFTVRYDADGKGAGDEVWFTYIMDNFPEPIIVSGSRVSRTQDCVVSWIGKLTKLTDGGQDE